MTRADVWRRLDIAATTDSKAIRSAYATRLKALDVDADRDAFALLRTARDQALAWAAAAPPDAGEPSPAEPPEKEGAPESLVTMALLRAPILAATHDRSAGIAPHLPDLPDGFAGLATAPAFTTPPTSADAPAIALPHWTVPVIHPLPAAEGRIHVGRAAPRDDQTLHALLIPADEQTRQQPLSDIETTQARGHIDALFAQSKAGTIDFDAQVQSWLSETLAQAWPRSQPLLAYAADRFGWEARKGQIDTPPAIAYINNRIEAERFVVAVQAPGHPLNRAWQQLRRPTGDGQTRAFWRQPKRVAELLGNVRRAWPELESHFDPHRVALWDQRQPLGSDIPWRLAIFGIIVLIQIISAVSRYNGEPDAPAVQTPALRISDPSAPVDRNPYPGPGSLTGRDPDMASAIHATLGPDITAEQLRNTAPLIELLFRTNWPVALDQGEKLDDYIAAMARIVRNRYAAIARQTGGEALVRYQWLRLAEARALQAHNWGTCSQVMRKGILADPDTLPAALAAGERKYISKLLLATPDNPRPLPIGGIFSIPGAIVGRTIAASGLTEDEVRDAFRQKGSDRVQCRADIALLQAILDSDAATRASLLPNI